ncbi:MAG: DUF4982 domain-containing protein [Bacteroidaceae bacterium]|nr:DUF4982 domain-containing protein [Bacteroidaceae bacterium]
MNRYFVLFVSLFLSAMASVAQRSDKTLKDGWRFHQGDVKGAEDIDFDDSKWERICVPHDWAIYGPFDRSHDLQKVAVKQNGESVATWKTGRSGGLPWAGIGWYRRVLRADELGLQGGHSGNEPSALAQLGDGVVSLQFDGAMSEAHVYVNGKEAIFWPYGYNTFHVDITGLLNKDGKDNVLAVRLENREQSHRWYPGAGLYRNVHLITTQEVRIPVWGTYVTTPHVEKDYATVCLKGRVAGSVGRKVKVVTRIKDDKGVERGVQTTDLANITPIPSGQQAGEQQFQQNFILQNPALWSPQSPALYYAESQVYLEDKLVDTYTTRFGVRSIELVAEKGFFLNGESTKFQGVCLHHDLGALGAAISQSAIRHQLTMLKAMGCNAIRTSHNMPAPELVELCDEMGLMMMVEPFDEWDVAKCANGYHRFWNEWAEKDMVNMLRHYRNNPSVVMWSIGNEVPTQGKKDGYRMVEFLQGICHREDATRPVTCGLDQVWTVLRNGFAATLDVPGFNYRTQYYLEGHEKLPQGYLLGSETASTVSSRGTYHFPVKLAKGAIHPDNQSSGYDVEACSWSNVPDEDFALAEDNEWEIGQFVWTGYDYLGEPSPYDTDAWPSHSSVFGIIDLASLPKDRYYLYRSVWNTQEHTLHVLPHWTWPGREGQVTPIFVYTDAPEAELFVNGKSMGRQKKLAKAEAEALKGKDEFWLQRRYRLMWNDVKYEPGEVKVVTYDKAGKRMDEKVLRTAGKPFAIKLNVENVASLKADGEDLAYVTVSVVDKDGNPCPTATNLVNFKVKGAGTFRAAANGDATCLDLFHLPQHHLFAGQCTAIVQSGKAAGNVTLEASAKGLKTAKLTLKVE